MIFVKSLKIFHIRESVIPRGALYSNERTVCVDTYVKMLITALF